MKPSSTLGHRGRRSAVVALALGLATTLWPVPAAPVPAPITSTATMVSERWQVAAKLGRGDGPATSCPTSSVCWAIAGGELLSSPDGGATWSTRTASVPADVDALDDLDCPTADVCFATALLADLSHVVLVLRAGVVSTSAVPGTGQLWTISCPSETRCLTTDGTIVYATTDGGASWQQRSSLLPGLGVPAVSCVPGTFICWAVHANSAGPPRIAQTSNFGNTWQSESAPGFVSRLEDVDCPSVNSCYAAGSYNSGAAVVATHDGGTTWTKETLPAVSGRLRSVSCPTPEACWAFGDGTSGNPVAVATATAGAHWAEQFLRSATGGAPDVSCPTTSVCAAVGSDGLAFVTTSGGATWTGVPVPVGLGTVSELSCPGRDRCVGMARDALLRPQAVTSTDGGASWTRRALPPTTGYVTSLDCPSITACHAWAFIPVPGTSRTRGQALRSTDGGVTWRLRQTAGTRGLAAGSLSCPTPTTCLAVGTGRAGPAVVRTTDGGLTWQPLPPPAGSRDLWAVSCATAASCVMLDRTSAAAFTTTDLGATHQQRALPPAYFYSGLDCVGSICVAVGNDVDYRGKVAASRDGGATWAAEPVPPDAFRLADVSCGSAEACAVTAANGNESGDGGQMMGTTSAGRSWATIPLPGTSTSWPLAVACVRERCLASDYAETGIPRILAGRV